MDIAWGKKVSADFKDQVIGMASRLGCDPNHLMAAMAFETGETFSPAIRNPSGATGLIQFMPATATALGTSTDALAGMTAEGQLAYVETYFRAWKGKLAALSDVYMAILWPRAVGLPDSFVLFAAPSQAYEQNRGLDANDDGKITKGEAAAKVQEKLTLGLSPDRCG